MPNSFAAGHPLSGGNKTTGLSHHSLFHSFALCASAAEPRMLQPSGDSRIVACCTSVHRHETFGRRATAPTWLNSRTFFEVGCAHGSHLQMAPQWRRKWKNFDLVWTADRRSTHGHLTSETAGSVNQRNSRHISFQWFHGNIEFRIILICFPRENLQALATLLAKRDHPPQLRRHVAHRPSAPDTPCSWDENVCEETNNRNDLAHDLNRGRNTGDLHGPTPLLWCASVFLR